MVPYQPDPSVPMEFNGRNVEANLTPAFWLIVKNDGREGFVDGKRGGASAGSIKAAVGIENNGVFRFCGMRWASQ